MTMRDPIRDPQPQERNMEPKMMVVRNREGQVEIPVLVHAGGILEFASGDQRPYDADVERLHEAKPWQIAEFYGMRRKVIA